MKKTTTLKALVLSAIMTLGLALPMMAQSDGFFRTADDYTDRASSSWYLINQTFGENPGTIANGGLNTQQFGSTPLGSGLLIMVAAGAGYVAVRRKRARKGMTLLLAAAMLLGMTQCKKRVETLTSNNQGGVMITLNLENNSKHHIVTSGQPFPNGNLGTIEWEEGDAVWVISAGAPVGKLEYNGNSFVGIIGPGNEIGTSFPVTPNAPLHFCYTGNIEPDGTTYTIDIGNQKDNMPVLSCGVSNENYPSEGNVYTAFMENKCALVKFTLDSGTTDDIRISDMIVKAQLVVTGSGVDILPTETRGSMVLNMPDSEKPAERWAVILPQNKVEAADALVRYTKYTGVVDVPKANVNGYIPDATITFSGATTSTVEPYFSIGNGKIVNIAPGNLQYKANSTSATEPPYTGVYRFAEHQWDYVGGQEYVGGDNPYKSWGNVYLDPTDEETKCNNDDISSTYTGWIDLFGCGTAQNPTEYRIDTEEHPAEPGQGCIYQPFKDWGYYNAIYNPSTNTTDAARTWFTMDKDEWEYLINNHHDHAIRRNKIAAATVHGVGGLVLLPDFFNIPSGCTFTLPTLDPTNPYDNIYNYLDLYSLNVYTDAQWGAMENAGAIFLPAAGQREGQDYHVWTNEHTGTLGLSKNYWTSERKGDYSGFAFSGSNAMWVDDRYCYYGYSVRLAREVDF